MIYSYQECIARYQNDYQLKKAIENGELYQIEKGLYSDFKYVSESEVLAKKYPHAIVTMNSAFYHYGLTDTIPTQSYLATDRDATKIKDSRIKQFYIPRDILELGVVREEQVDYSIRIYSKERMLVELVRNKSKFPYDYYKEIVNNYRKMIDQLDIQAVEEIALAFPKSNKIIKTLQDEVF